MKMNFKLLHEKAVQISKSYLRAESDLIAVLQEIDDCKGYRELQFKSLYEYATQCLGLSESVSYNLITIARKSKEVPKLQEMIQKREMTVSNARMISPVLTFENQEKWLSAAAELPKRSLEKEIAKEFPERQVQERMKYVSEKCVELKLGLSEDVHELLKHAQDLVSSRKGGASSLGETLRSVLEFYIEKNDPQRKAERADARQKQNKIQISTKTNKAQPVPGQVKVNQRYIPAQLEHAVRLRDQGRCTQKNPNGQRCDEKRWLDIHHIKPLSHGGVMAFENLTLLCRGHHKLLHH